MVKNRFTILLVFIFTTIHVFGQNNRYMVFFTDKDNSPYSITTPQDFLSQKAINRKGREAISLADLPVNKVYLDGLEQLGIEGLFPSKWMNVAMVIANATLMESVDLTYYERYELIAAGYKTNIRNTRKNTDNDNGRN